MILINLSTHGRRLAQVRKAQAKWRANNPNYRSPHADPEKHRKTSRESAARRRDQDPDRFREQDRDRYASGPARRAQVKSNAAAHRAAGRHLERMYGITLADYDAMLVSQNGGCACCGATRADDRGSRFRVDHCHVTSAVRGLLCAKCNTGIGLLGDNAESVQRAVAYLMRGKS